MLVSALSGMCVQGSAERMAVHCGQTETQISRWRFVQTGTSGMTDRVPTTQLSASAPDGFCYNSTVLVLKPPPTCRRERNRASALEAYYRGKARRAELEGQLRELRGEDAALKALDALAQSEPATGGVPIPTIETKFLPGFNTVSRAAHSGRRAEVSGCAGAI